MTEPTTEQLRGEATVHVVDDDPSVRRALGRALKAEGWSVREFPSAREFIESTRSDAVGCLLLDVRMPGLSGLELQDLLVANHIDLPIIFMTGHGDIPMTVRAMKAGAVDFLPKPVDRDRLLEVVLEAVRRQARERNGGAPIRTFLDHIEKLTAREREVIDLVATGLLNKQIADRLDITEYTVKVHRGRAMRKLEVESVAELARLWERAGLGEAES